IEKAPTDTAWRSPSGPLTTKAIAAAAAAKPEAERGAYLAEHQKPYSLLYTYSLIMALVCGTAGLPHILVRFYTNPDGAAAKRTTMWVMILIGVFYLFPPVFGVMGRNLLPELYAATGAKGTDKIVLELPRILNERGRSPSLPTPDSVEAAAVDDRNRASDTNVSLTPGSPSRTEYQYSLRFFEKKIPGGTVNIESTKTGAVGNVHLGPAKVPLPQAVAA